MAKSSTIVPKPCVGCASPQGALGTPGTLALQAAPENASGGAATRASMPSTPRFLARAPRRTQMSQRGPAHDPRGAGAGANTGNRSIVRQVSKCVRCRSVSPRLYGSRLLLSQDKKHMYTPSETAHFRLTEDNVDRHVREASITSIDSISLDPRMRLLTILVTCAMASPPMTPTNGPSRCVARCAASMSQHMPNHDGTSMLTTDYCAD